MRAVRASNASCARTGQYPVRALPVSACSLVLGPFGSTLRYPGTCTGTRRGGWCGTRWNGRIAAVLTPAPRVWRCSAWRRGFACGLGDGEERGPARWMYLLELPGHRRYGKYRPRVVRAPKSCGRTYLGRCPVVQPALGRRLVTSCLSAAVGMASLLGKRLCRRSGEAPFLEPEDCQAPVREGGQAKGPKSRVTPRAGARS